MTIYHFLMYVGFTQDKPDYISSVRWNSMLKWYAMRVKLGEEFIF